MQRMKKAALAFALLAAVWPRAAEAQIILPVWQAGPRSPSLGSVPDQTVTSAVLPLSLPDAIQRGLTHNLGVMSSQQAVSEAQGVRLRSLAALLPHVEGRLAAVRQKVNLEAFGFGGFGESPLVGPYNVFDARLHVSQAVLDLSAANDARADKARLDAAKFANQDMRDLVVLVCANLYLRAVASESRVEAARAELTTAEALERLATDRKQAGLAAGIEVLRAQVQVQSRRQQLLAADNDREKSKLQLARAVGIPLAQPFTLTDQVPYAPIEPMALGAALDLAYRSRADYRQQESLLAAAEASRRAAADASLPSVYVTSDFGPIGQTPSSALGTFSVTAAVRVPVFDGGERRGRRREAEARWQQRQAELADLKGRIDLEVRTALLDLTSADQQLQTARTARALADAQLTQATDRFAAGIASNLEVVEAQQAVAAAAEGYITTLYAYNVAKAAFVRALGRAEERAPQISGDLQP